MPRMEAQSGEVMDLELTVHALLSKIEEVGEDGLLERLSDGSFVVLLKGENTDIVEDPHARCLNPENENPAERVYIRIFSNKTTTWTNRPDLSKNPLSTDLDELPYIPKEGYIERLSDGRVVALNRGAPPSQVARFTDIECLNPEADPSVRVYRKIFVRKKVYLPDEYEKATHEVLGGENTFVLSMNGFTDIGEEKLRNWHLVDGEYEAGCDDLLDGVVIALQQRFKEATLKLVDGGSLMGVDLAIQRVKERHNLTSLSFSTPAWMVFVPDNDDAVYVGANADEYADRYIRSLNFLITTGGRDQALKHDVYAGILYGKRIHFVDVANALAAGRGGVVPPTRTEEDGRVRVENAVAAMRQYISISGISFDSENSDGLTERWERMVQDTSIRAIEACRPNMKPGNMFRSRTGAQG